MNFQRSTLLGPILLCTLLGAAWMSGSYQHASANTSKSPKRSVRLVMLYNTTPSPAWSPNGRYIVYHEVNPQYRLVRSTRTRHLRRSTHSRYLRRSTRSRYLRRSTKTGVILQRKPRLSRKNTGILRPLKTRRVRPVVLRKLVLQSPYSSTASSHLVVLDTHNMTRRTVRYIPPPVKHFVRTSRNRHIRRPTPSAPRRIAFFHPYWLDASHVLTSTGFYTPGAIINVMTRQIIPTDKYTIAAADPGRRFLVGRMPQTGVFLAPLSNPKQKYALVGKDRKIGGLYPTFSPNGRRFAWLEAGTDSHRGNYLQVFDHNIGSMAQLTKTRLLAKDPWSYRKKVYPAQRLKKVATCVLSGQATGYAWHPNSRHIAVVMGKRSGMGGRYADRDRGLYLFDTLTKKSTLIQKTGVNPFFSPDGRLFFNHNGGGLFVWNPKLKKNKLQKLLHYGTRPRLSPDGHTLMFLKRTRGYDPRLYLALMHL